MQIKKIIRGRISINQRGFGFVTPKEKGLEDLFIPAGKLNGALDGDEVTARVLAHSPKGYEGEVVDVKQRKRTHLAGTIVFIHKNGDAAIFAPAAGEKREITLKKQKNTQWKIGDRVSLEILSSTDKEIICSLDQILGDMDNALLDTKIAILEYGIRNTFSKSCLKEANSFKEDLEVTSDRVDLTHLHTITIDPTTAKDYDDALSIEKDKNGCYHLGVHIADVSHFVPEGSDLDVEAYTRSNSTYFIDGVVPMLPESLSNNLCSLKENVNRYVISVLMTLSPKGELLNYQIVRSVIHSRKRFTYEEALELLQSDSKSPHLKVLKLLVELCSHFKEERKKRFSVDLAMTEVRLIMGNDGVPIGKEKIEYDITHQMVEEFMLKANEVVATHLIKEGRNSIFRVHEEPSADTLKEFFSYARLLGFRLPAEPNEKDIQTLFEMAQKSPHLEKLAIRYIRSMKLAIYSEKNKGHYGLALENYTHFTSPIRRYSDLVIHRLLFDKNYNPDLQEIADQCTEKERLSFKAEMSVLKLKKLRFIDRLTDEDPETIFAGTITNTKATGIYFDLDFIGLEGFIHVSEIGGDYYLYNEKNKTFTGERSGLFFQIGKKIYVQLASIDLVYQECTWLLCHNEKKLQGRGKVI